MANDRSPSCAAVLIVEDDHDIRSALQAALELEGYEVHTAQNGKVGLERLAAIPRPCLILLDLMMPVMNGFEFLEAMGADDAIATIPVVVVSAYSDLARQAAVDAYIKKPVDLDQLLDLVAQHCSPSAAARR